MRVEMNVKFFDKDKNEISEYDRASKQSYFKFVLKYCPLEIGKDSVLDSYRFMNDQYGEVLSQSELKEIKDGCVYNHSFVTQTWGYDCTNRLLFIYNQPIEI
jgi:hypothetical protein